MGCGSGYHTMGTIKVGDEYIAHPESQDSGDGNSKKKLKQGAADEWQVKIVEDDTLTFSRDVSGTVYYWVAKNDSTHNYQIHCDSSSETAATHFVRDGAYLKWDDGGTYHYLKLGTNALKCNETSSANASGMCYT